MQKNFIETLAGLVVLSVAALFIWMAYDQGIVEGEVKDGYLVNAVFDSIDGIEMGCDVRVSGVKVGKVVDISLNNPSYSAQVQMKVFHTVKLPSDTSAEILMMGLMGGKYISLVPGAEDDTLKDGDSIEFTQSPINLESLIGKLIFGAADKAEKKNDEVVVDNVLEENKQRDSDAGYNHPVLHHHSTDHVAVSVGSLACCLG